MNTTLLTKDELLARYGWQDPLVVDAFTQQERQGWDDDTLYRHLIVALLARHKNLHDAYTNALKHMHSSVVFL